MEDLWAEHGWWAYPLVFIWTFFEGETVVLVGGAAARVFGTPDPFILFLVAWWGSFLGDQCWFFVGRRWGRPFVAKRPRLAARVERALHLLDRYGVLFILSFRFLYGIRNVASVAIGLSPMSWTKFALWNFLAAALWSASFVAGGYFLGALLGPKGVAIALGCVVLAAVGGVLIRHWWRRGMTASPARQGASPGP
ncbi:DedA family protein [Sabulicella rubraurantiaca]|uniref:DedA family protein n=1 Tax=Sabulicella rubraurantiaca TaxID=2811429 RepID=UPI001F17C850|nr:DedA family protein [Sabulicella rubraurantiaca]